MGDESTAFCFYKSVFLNQQTGLKQIIVVSRYISMLSEKLWILK